MYCATCGTSSTISRRVWSLDIGLDDTTGPSCAAPARRPVGRGEPRALPSRRDRDEHGALRPGPDRREVVAAGDELDVEPGVLGEARQLVGGDQAERDPGGPSGAAARPAGPPRRSRSASTVPVAAS